MISLAASITQVWSGDARGHVKVSHVVCESCLCWPTRVEHNTVSNWVTGLD